MTPDDLRAVAPWRMSREDSDRFLEAGVLLPCVGPDCGYGMLIIQHTDDEKPTAPAEVMAVCVSRGSAHTIRGFKTTAELKAWVRYLRDNE